MRGLRGLGADVRNPGEDAWDAMVRGYVEGRGIRRQNLAEGRENAPFLSATMEAAGAALSPVEILRVAKTAPMGYKIRDYVPN